MKKVIKKKSIGTNVRLSEDAFTVIKNYCAAKGYKIGAFVEKAALTIISHGY